VLPAGTLGVNLSIYAALRGEGLQFAMPTITLNDTQAAGNPRFHGLS